MLLASLNLLSFLVSGVSELSVPSCFVAYSFLAALLSSFSLWCLYNVFVNYGDRITTFLPPIEISLLMFLLLTVTMLPVLQGYTSSSLLVGRASSFITLNDHIHWILLYPSLCLFMACCKFLTRISIICSKI